MAETWTTITPAMVRASMADGEFDAFASAALTPGGADPVTQSIRQVVAQIQGAVGASGRNIVGPAGTVPPELEAEACILIMENLSTRIPQSGLVWDDVRKTRLSEAKTILKDIRKGDFLTTEPEAGSDTSAEPDSGGYGGAAQIDFSDLR